MFVYHAEMLLGMLQGNLRLYRINIYFSIRGFRCLCCRPRNSLYMKKSIVFFHLMDLMPDNISALSSEDTKNNMPVSVPNIS